MRPSTNPAGESTLFDQRVAHTAEALANDGLPPEEIRLPYIGPAATVERGAVVPGVVAREGAGNPAAGAAPAPSGIAYYGENDTNGTVVATTLDASSLVGSVTIDRLKDVSLDANTPDVSGIQLNAVITNVTLQGTRGFEFWTQNTIDFYQENDTINFGEDTWNFSGSPWLVPSGTSTVLSHDSTGAVVAGIYLGLGPFLHAPMPFTVTLYLNSSVTASDEQELWYNYSLDASGEPRASGNYDWLIFNSTDSAHPATVVLAPFEATGTHLNPLGIPNDFELDFGIGSYDGTTLEVLSANMSATLDYCPSTVANCAPGQFRSVPAAEDFGSETGESSSGLSIAYSGTTAYATAGPFILRGLWGYGGAVGSAPGATPVTNAIAFSGSPDSSLVAPYAFVFLNGSTSIDSTFEWAPDVPTWYLPPGTYSYEVMLADYAQENGTLVVGASPTSLSADLAYDPTAGVYTPLWAFSNGELAGISSSGTGTLEDQYAIFNNPTSACLGSECSVPGVLNPAFFAYNDFEFPEFAGILFEGTSAYLTIDHPVSFCVGAETWDEIVPPGPTIYFYLQIELIQTHNATLANDPGAMGWPAMFELLTLAGTVSAAENFFPTANVVVWNSTNDLILSNDFVATALVPPPGEPCFGFCYLPVECNVCVSPDGLLVYGGTRNTVWGNTFLDPSNAPVTVAQQYAGLAEAENGDLIYNNNFSVDNPTVYLPYDLYNESCGYGYAGGCLPLVTPTYSDTWNVTPQSASRVAETVNGFPLSGSVLGAGCSMQGGNYWNDYGNVPNPFGTLPFTNVYNYSAVASIFPVPGPNNQRSIRAGGDYAPLLPSACPAGPDYGVAFEEVGLPVGTSWNVSINGHNLSSLGPWINFSLPNGPYTFYYANSTSPGAVAHAGFTVASASLLIRINWTTRAPEPTYAVVFSETGLPSGTEWYVNLTGGPSGSTVGPSVSFELPNGSYPFSVASSVKLYAPGSATGLVTVSGAPIAPAVTFSPVVFVFAFQETGLPIGTNWSVTLSSKGAVVMPPAPPGTSSVTRWSDGASDITVGVSNGSYSYSANASGYTASPGTFSVAGSSPPEVNVVFRTNSASTPGFAGLSRTDFVWLGAGLAALIAAIVAVLLLRRRGRKAAPDGKPRSPEPSVPPRAVPQQPPSR